MAWGYASSWLFSFTCASMAWVSSVMILRRPSGLCASVASMLAAARFSCFCLWASCSFVGLLSLG